MNSLLKNKLISRSYTHRQHGDVKLCKNVAQSLFSVVAVGVSNSKTISIVCLYGSIEWLRRSALALVIYFRVFQSSYSDLYGLQCLPRSTYRLLIVESTMYGSWKYALRR